MRVLTLLLASLSIVACDSDSVRFTGPKDQTALDFIVGSWYGPDDLYVYLNWDTTVLADGCDVVHVILPGQVDLDEEAAPGLGLDSCPHHVVASVHGTVSGGPYGATSRAVSGRVVLGTLADGEALYDRPYVLDVRCDAVTAPCLVRGTFDADGYLTLTYQDGRSLGALARW
jgi:hypothetical protein